MPVLCKHCKRCHILGRGPDNNSRCDAKAEDQQDYVTGVVYRTRPLCNAINHDGNCELFEPKEPPKPVYRDALGREFTVQDALLYVPGMPHIKTSVLLLVSLSHDTQTGNLRVRGRHLSSHNEAEVVGTARENFTTLYRLGPTDEILKAQS